jgi:hypothetical protein
LKSPRYVWNQKPAENRITVDKLDFCFRQTELSVKIGVNTNGEP